ncbi:MAG TPA: hypothetical protein PLH11_04340 [Gemmobacter sp.]|nr:hypothetical protein [Gemmobacter sp.]
MTTPPLDRDQQIAVMTGARERRAAVLARWAKDEGIQQMFRQPVEQMDAHSLLQADAYLQLRHA